MLLTQARLVGVGPLCDVTFRFADDAGTPRRTVVVLGGGGVGKTTLLSTIAATRPGYAAQLPRRGDAAAFAALDWQLGEDDPVRPHPLRVASPNAPADEQDVDASLRRREQALFERRAPAGGFAISVFPAHRWFSRTPVVLAGADRSYGRYDVRSTPSFDDATRADLTRETKQALSYPTIAAALVRATDPQHTRVAACHMVEGIDRALREAVAPLAAMAGYTFLGADPLTLEPMFIRTTGGPPVPFDDLPTHARHLVAFAALTLRVLHAAYPGRDPRYAEGVALIDEADLYQDTNRQHALVPALRAALPGVQWVLTTSSPCLTLGCSPNEVLALRRAEASDVVELFEGALAVVH